MPELIINNIAPLNGSVSSQGLETKPAFLKNLFVFNFQEFSPSVYVFKGKDCDHELLCEMTLKLKESFVCLEEEKEGYLAPVITCNFPSISVQKFNEKTGFDPHLQGIVMSQFQLKILEQLFLFCKGKDAVNLIITVNGVDLDYLEIFSRFLISEKQVTTAKGEQKELVIPIDADTYGEVVDFIDEVHKGFRKTLSHGQTIKPVFREYLKGHSLSAI